MKKVILLTVATIIYGHFSVAQIIYPDNNLPVDTPTLFAKNVISTGLANRDFTISPTGDELFYTIQHPKFIASVIIRLSKIKGKWGKPEVAPFSGVFRDLEASFSPDGKTLFFSSDRPLTGNQPKRDFDIWKITKASNGSWGKPENLGVNVNTAKNEFFPSVAKSGNLYFTVEAPYGKGGEDIVVCSYAQSDYLAPVSLSESVNTAHGEFNAFIDPDKKYLIFTSNRLRKEWHSNKAVNYTELNGLLSGSGNGQDDIYWVKFNYADY